MSGDEDRSLQLGEWRGHYERGQAYLQSGEYQQAVRELTDALKQYGAAAALSVASGKEPEAQLLLSRSSAFIGLSKQLRQRPAAASERQALYNLDPTQLAQLGLQDARRAADLLPHSADACLAQGEALFQLERYPEAEEAVLRGLGHDPEHAGLQRCLSDTQRLLAASPTASAPARKRKAAAEAADDLECVLCMKLLYDPSTTSCGHSFCRSCLLQALDHSNRCPVCRTVLHTGRELAVTIALKKLLLRTCPDEYQARQQEHEAAAGAAARQAADTYQLPLFVMSAVVPGERMSLNIFEPRYRLLVRRCMEGGRRFGMAQVASRSTPPGDSVGGLEVVACEVEILECVPQPDGRYHIEIQGRRRVRLQQTWDQDGYRMARVQAFHDDPPSPRAPATPATSGGTAAAASTSAAAAPADAPTGGDGASGAASAAVAAEGPTLEAVAAEVEELAATLLERIRGMMARRVPGAGLGQLQALLDGLGEKPGVRADPEAFSFWVAALLQRTLQVDVSPLLALTSTRERLLLERRALQRAHTSGTPCCIM